MQARTVVPDPTPAALNIHELMRPEAFPHRVESLALRETHISWVLLTGPFAYKVRKPLRFDFIDNSTLQQRRHHCEEEVRLNRRLAPELYVDVVPISHVDGRAVVGGQGPPSEYAVRMRQFDSSSELPALLERRAVDDGDLAALGELLADFHLKAVVLPRDDVGAHTQRMLDAVLGNLGQLLAHTGPEQVTQKLSRLVDWTRASARNLESSFHERERSGFIRECHGDLHAANIVRLQQRLVPFDCIEFDPALRRIDVISDIAFLVMDLASHDRPDLAFALLSRYLEVTGDYDGMRLLPFYAVYRALVRAKVDAISAEQVPSRAAEFRERLQCRLEAATTWMSRPRPRLILMHGPSGSGKSWLSQRLVPALRAIRIRSDLERKRLAGIAPEQAAAAPVRKGIYSPEFSDRTYARLADCAEVCLLAGISVIVDAAFLDQEDRELFHTLAQRLRVPVAIVACQADPQTLAIRLEERAKARKDASDANLSVLDTQLREITAFTSGERQCVVAIDTDAPHPIERAVAAVDALCSA
jgi:aminoglycoside phosphotransferase family enzyme/predicted kinase